MYKERPILYASNQMEDGYREFLCGFDDHCEEDSKVISLRKATIIDPSINDVPAIPVGSSIQRAAGVSNGRGSGC